MKSLSLAVAVGLLITTGCTEQQPLPPKPQIFLDREAVIMSGFVGAAPQESIKIENRGLETLVISSATISGDSAFTITGPSETSIKGKQHAFVTVYFAPTAVRDYTATLTIVSNAENAPQKTVAISGKGVNP